MIAFIFENNGFEVIKSNKAISAEQISELKPHIIIIDHTVNDTPGNDICLKLKTNELTRNIPIILYSPNLNIDKISINSCADGFVAKPFELDDFIYLVHRIALS